MLARRDSSKEIEEALRISKEFGPSSKEARVAWDIVEEIDASDNIRKAFKLNKPEDFMGLSQSEENYVHTVKSLADILSNVIEPAISPIKTLISYLKESEENDPKLSKLGGPLPENLANLLSEAKAADDIYGPSSSKSSDAWSRAENLAVDIDISGMKASDVDEESKVKFNRYKEAAVTSHHDFSTVIDPNFLEETIEALTKLEHFTSLVVIEKNRLVHGFEERKGEKSKSFGAKKQP